MENRYDDPSQLLEDIKQLNGYEGYIQFSDEKIRECDIFSKGGLIASRIKPTKGFVHEAHFFNGVSSIAIRQINNSWLVDKTANVPLTDTQIYHAIGDRKVKMAQIWEPKEDEFCEDMKALKLKKVVFAGFES